MLREAKPGEILTGDAVVPVHDPDSDVLTVFDVTQQGRLIHCNVILPGTHRMIKSQWPVHLLARVQRKGVKP